MHDQSENIANSIAAYEGALRAKGLPVGIPVFGELVLPPDDVDRPHVAHAHVPAVKAFELAFPHGGLHLAGDLTSAQFAEYEDWKASL